MACKYCADPDYGRCLFPYYGKAPHKHIVEKGVLYSIDLSKEEWPDNFELDEDVRGFGIWAHCPECGDSE